MIKGKLIGNILIKSERGSTPMHIQKQEIPLNINYSTPYQPWVQFRKENLVQFREKYDK